MPELVRPDERVDLVHLPALMPRRECRPVLEHDLDAVLRVIAAVDPTLERRCQEFLRDRLVRLVLDPVVPHEDLVLEHRRTGALRRVLHLDHVQVGELVELPGLRVLAFEHLGQLVVCHGCSGIHLAVEEQVHVERLVDDRDVVLVLRVDAVLRERGIELRLVAAAPHADLLALHLRDRGDAAVLPGQLGHAAPRVDLSDAHDLFSAVTEGEHARNPVDTELRLLAEHNLLGCDRRAADLQVHVEPGLRVVPLRLRGVEPRELRLGDPLQLQGHLCCLRGLRARRQLRSRCCASRDHKAREHRDSHHPPVLHPVPPSRETAAILSRCHSVWKALADGCQLVVNRSASATTA